MEIEKVNDHTIKLRMTYKDIEDRGFTMEEIWYNREKGEELFWKIMDELSVLEDFSPDGLLWIQVQASERGLDVTITSSQDGSKMGKDMSKAGVPFDEQFLEHHLKQLTAEHEERVKKKDAFEAFYILVFDDIEDVIALSQQVGWEDVRTTLYQFEGQYYMSFEFDRFLFEEHEAKILASLTMEYGRKTGVTIHRLKEYGNCIVENNALTVLERSF